MSTRSGKRIHKSMHENILNNTEVDLKSDRKTRSRRLKENCDALNISLPKPKKQNIYVRYPKDDEASDVAEHLPPRTLRKNTLKEFNIDVSTISNAAEKTKVELIEKSTIRFTRRTRKIADDVEEDHAKTNKVNGDTASDSQTPNKNQDTEVANQSKKAIKNKRKKTPSDNEITTNTEPDGQGPQKNSRKKKKKKGTKRSGSMVVEDIVLEDVNEKRKALNLTNTSLESFHSAAGSPQQEGTRRQTPRKETKKTNGTFEKSPAIKKTVKYDHITADTTLTKESEALSINVLEKSSDNRTSDVEPKDITFDVSGDKISDETLTKHNATFDKDEVPRTVPQKTIKGNKTMSDQNIIDIEPKDQLNTTIDLPRKNAGDRISKVKAPDTTFDKLSDISDNSDSKKLYSTYDKVDKNCTPSPTRSKSSLIISDNGESTANLTFDKSDENIAKISLTSDDSKSSIENILNTTPVLIESSMETSRISEASPKPPTPKAAKESAGRSNPPIIPLKREGTFTKDGPDVAIVTSPRQRKSTDNASSVTTPAKRKMSLPAPGCTPFHSNTKVVPREKSILNRTHSIEKPITRRSSLTEVAKPTRVMFCSPVDNPLLNTQRKSKLIKSSLKGSNKSFLFEETGTPPKRPANRKRSFTQSDAEPPGAKRKRLADDMQTSVDRLSRPRTSSATVKPTESLTPAKTVPASTKSESKISRSKLPNFAALHQRRFQKMESLDECQERKAKRAKRMLVPTGSLTVLERGSPKASEAPTSVTTAPETKKLPPLPTKIEPPKSTHTRFGFKLNLDVNPFSIPSKNPERKPVETKPNGLLKRQPTLPSLAGATVRKEVAKLVIMREKSATTLREKRNMKRDETRTVIKGVRTNRRFELQMRSRNINGSNQNIQYGEGAAGDKAGCLRWAC